MNRAIFPKDYDVTSIMEAKSHPDQTAGSHPRYLDWAAVSSILTPRMAYPITAT